MKASDVAVSLLRRVVPVSLRPGVDLKGAYTRHTEGIRARLPEREAMELAVGGKFDTMMGILAATVRRCGLQPDQYLIDVGCGSGRLALPLSKDHKGPYLGFDVVDDLVAYARKTVDRPDWRFEVIDHIGIPEKDGVADMVCFFSVLTHLLHEQSYWYLEEAKRVLKPGGTVVFSFLEFREPGHWEVMANTLAAAKMRYDAPLNVFIDREAIGVWAEHLGLEVVEIRGAAEVLVPEGNLGQALCVLRKPG